MLFGLFLIICSIWANILTIWGVSAIFALSELFLEAFAYFYLHIPAETGKF